MMSDTQIDDLARRGVSDLEAVVKLADGHTSDAYKLTAPSGDFVLLQEKENSAGQSDYGHTFGVLELLQKHNYPYAPKPVWLEDDNKAIIMSFEEGVEADTFDFEAHGIDPKQIAFSIFDTELGLSSVSYDEYLQQAKKHGFVPEPVYSPAEDTRRYGVERLQEVIEGCPDEDIVEWLKDRTPRHIEEYLTIPRREPTLGHQDLTDANILIREDGTFSVVDWGMSSFKTAPFALEAQYALMKVGFMKPLREEIIEHVAGKLGKDPYDFSQEIEVVDKINTVFGVNWAASMIAKIDRGEYDGDIESYRQMAHDGMLQYAQKYEQ